jgi:putative hydrolase of the HAD superfamily
LNRQTILFDLDDTLIHCNKYFEVVIDQFADQMQTWFSAHRLSKREIKEKQQELDIMGVHAYGFVASRFPQSLIETYAHYSGLTGRAADETEKQWLLRLGYSVYEYQVEPYPNMEQTLTEIQARHHLLYLYTGGDPQIQRKKVKQAGLDAYFADRVIVTAHKTIKAMKDLLDEHGFARDHTWMIGNSVTTDIVPALEAGIHAIHIPAVTEWSFNTGKVDAVPRGAFFQLGSLREVPQAIDRYLAQRAAGQSFDA